MCGRLWVNPGVWGDRGVCGGDLSVCVEGSDPGIGGEAHTGIWREVIIQWCVREEVIHMYGEGGGGFRGVEKNHATLHICNLY